jgi:HEAT repeat protein
MRKATLVAAVLLAVALLPGCRKKDVPRDPQQLLVELRSPDAGKSGRARLLLITMGEPAVPAVTGLLRSGTPAERTLENLGPAAADAVPALTKAIGAREPAVRQAAVKALGAIGPAAEAALPTLTRALRRGSWPEAEEAVRRIRGLDPGAVLDLGPEEPEAP